MCGYFGLEWTPLSVKRANRTGLILITMSHYFLARLYLGII